MARRLDIRPASAASGCFKPAAHGCGRPRTRRPDGAAKCCKMRGRYGGLAAREIRGGRAGTDRRPGGAETYLRLLVAEAIREGDDFQLTRAMRRADCRGSSSSITGRICWLALRGVPAGAGARDADHSLAVMETLSSLPRCSATKDWDGSHHEANYRRSSCSTRGRPGGAWHEPEGTKKAPIFVRNSAGVIKNKGLGTRFRVLLAEIYDAPKDRLTIFRHELVSQARRAGKEKSDAHLKITHYQSAAPSTSS